MYSARRNRAARQGRRAPPFESFRKSFLATGLEEICCSLQRPDRQRWDCHTAPIPVINQLALMLRRPFEHHVADATGRIALDDPQRRDTHYQFPLSVDGVEMRGECSYERHADDDAVEF